MEKENLDYQKNAFIEKLIEIVHKSENAVTESPRKVLTKNPGTRLGSTTILARAI